jgi:hypothetical protein
LLNLYIPVKVYENSDTQKFQIYKENKNKSGVYRRYAPLRLTKLGRGRNLINSELVFLYLAMGSFTDISYLISQEPSILFAIVGERAGSATAPIKKNYNADIEKLQILALRQGSPDNKSRSGIYL